MCSNQNKSLVVNCCISHVQRLYEESYCWSRAENYQWLTAGHANQSLALMQTPLHRTWQTETFSVNVVTANSTTLLTVSDVQFDRRMVKMIQHNQNWLQYSSASVKVNCNVLHRCQCTWLVIHSYVNKYLKTYDHSAKFTKQCLTVNVKHWIWHRNAADHMLRPTAADRWQINTHDNKRFFS